VLVHGLGGTGAEIWKHQISDLAATFRVVAYDLRGSGASDVTPGPYSIDLLADDLRALIEELALGRVALVAHSMGGSIALAYAARYPSEVSALVGIGAPAEFPEQARTGLEGRAATVEADGMGAVAETVATNGVSPTFREGHPQAFQELIAMLAANDPEGYAAQCRALVGLDIAGRLDGITAPVLLLSGDRDGVSPPAVTEANAARIPGGRFAIVEDCGHILTWEKPAELASAAWPLLHVTLT
jgi:3-oxoadipate enol-lactonase